MYENSFIENIDNIEDNSKLVREKKKYKKKELSVFSYKDYKTGNIILEKHTIPILKKVCKSYQLRVTGRKKELIDRIICCFNKISASIIIQKNLRKLFVKMLFKLYESNVCDRSQCVNETDFSTLEPIIDIPKEYFYSYTDEKGFLYGFDIISLIELLRKVKKVYNPYTRELFSQEQKNTIIKMYNLNFITNHKFKNENKYFIRQIPRSRSYTIRNRYQDFITRLANELRPNNIDNNQSSYNNYNPIVNPNIVYPQNDDNERYQQIVEIRQKTLQERINRLFTEIDQLGNYTQNSWFSNLSHLQCAQYYRCLFDIWNYRGQLTRMLKLQICPFHPPFDGIFARNVRHIDLSLEEIKTTCIIVMENMVYSGINNEIRQIGAFHVLTALTMVSIPARHSMPWLYESIVF